MDKIFAHPRVSKQHPELSDSDVASAWHNAICSYPLLEKDYDEYIVVGFDSKFRLIEIIAKRDLHGDWLIYHAMTPPSRKTMRKTGLDRNEL